MSWVLFSHIYNVDCVPIIPWLEIMGSRASRSLCTCRLCSLFCLLLPCLWALIPSAAMVLWLVQWLCSGLRPFLYGSKLCDLLKQHISELCWLLLSFYIMKQTVYKLELSFLSPSESNCQLQSCNKSEHLKVTQRSFCVCKALTVRLWFWKTSQTKASSFFRIIWIFKAMKLGRFGSEVLIIGSFLFFILLSVLAQIVDTVYQFSLILRLQNS